MKRADVKNDINNAIFTSALFTACEIAYVMVLWCYTYAVVRAYVLIIVLVLEATVLETSLRHKPLQWQKT